MSKAVVRFALVALLVVSAGVPAGAGTVAAETGHCSELDDFIFTVTNGLFNAGECKPSKLSDTIQEMKESDANQTEVDIFSAATSLQAQGETFDSVYDNYMQDTEAVVWMDVEKAVAQAYKNGSTKPEAKAAARQAISDYYSVKAANVLQQQKVVLTQLDYLSGQARMEDGVSDSFVHVGGHQVASQSNVTVNGTLEEISVTLPNGTEHTALKVNSSTFKGTNGLSVKSPYAAQFGGTPASEAGWSVIRVSAPNDNFSPQSVYNFSVDSERWNETHELNDQLQSEAENFVDATWQDFDSGQVNATDVVSSTTAMFEFGVRSSNESEGLYRSTAALSMMGFDTPNMSSAGMMTVRYQGTNHTGLVLADNAPGGSWETGVTYDPANISGPVFMATANGTKLDLSNSFKIVSMTAKDGSKVETQETTQYNYKTADVNELLKKQQKLLELRQEIENREPDSGGGGGFGDGSVPMWVGAALACGVVLLVVLRE